MTAARSQASVAIVGGGLAGLAAADAASRMGYRVELFEAKRRLGGRAGSFYDSHSRQLVDYCQHVAMGCCTRWAEFCRNTRIEDCFIQHRCLHFIDRNGGQHDFQASAWLPAPWHLLPAFARLGYLTIRQRWRILTAMLRLRREGTSDVPGGETIDQWLARHGQTAEIRARFWEPILVAALSESLEQVSVAAARQVFVEGFLSSRRAYELYLPNRPLGEIYDRRVRESLAARGVVIHTGARVRLIEGTPARADSLLLADGSRRAFDHFIVAADWLHLHRLFSTEPSQLQLMRDVLADSQGLEKLQPAPITGLHLWFDRAITPLPHAVLLERTAQWMFNHGGPPAGSVATPPGFHYQIVISNSRTLLSRVREEVVREVLAELAAVWPAAQSARLLTCRMVTHPAAVFSMRPGVQRYRPGQATGVSNLRLAGDWTATGWPATMEGAVRSGYLAAESLPQV